MPISGSLLVANIFPIIGCSLELNRLGHGNRRDEESKLTSTFGSLIESNQTRESGEDLSTSSGGETINSAEAEGSNKQGLEDALISAVEPPGDPNIVSIDKVSQTSIGTSTSISENGESLQSDPTERSRRGAIWPSKKINLLSDFILKPCLYLGNRRGRAGNGMIFTLTGDPRMTSNPSQVVGSSGIGIGSYSTRSDQPYIANVFSIEFDTCKNSDSSGRMDREITADNRGHGYTAFVMPKSNNNNYSEEHIGVTTAPTFFSNSA